MPPTPSEHSLPVWQSDPYVRLRPPAPTPDDEICHCQGAPPVKLVNTLGANPVRCMACNGEVPPDVLAPTPAIVDAIAGWLNVYDALDRLWLDSQEYEDWARSQLEDIHSPVNRRGLQARESVATLRPCYYWCFHDQTRDDLPPVAGCPLCHGALTRYPAPHGDRVCERCKLVME